MVDRAKPPMTPPGPPKRTYSTISGIAWDQPIGGALRRWSAEDWVFFIPLVSFNIGVCLFLFDMDGSSYRDGGDERQFSGGMVFCACVLSYLSALYGMGFARDMADRYGEDTLRLRLVFRVVGNFVPIGIIAAIAFFAHFVGDQDRPPWPTHFRQEQGLFRLAILYVHRLKWLLPTFVSLAPLIFWLYVRIQRSGTRPRWPRGWS